MMVIHDAQNTIDFQTWLLYPSPDAQKSINIGPYTINACPEGNISKGKFPLVIISHGGGGSHLVYRTVARHLAQNGYVVAMPEHHKNNRNDNSLEGENSNITLRTGHIRLVIDTLLCHAQFATSIDTHRIFMIGHSMGGCTALAVAGAVPWSMDRQKIPVTHDERVKGLVLFAPAAAWFQHPESFQKVNLPILVFAAQHDTVTPRWQAEMIKQRATNPFFVHVKLVKNAGHLSFLAPFPESMKNENFPPSLDPPGFDRAAFHETLKVDVLNFFNQQPKNTNLL